MKITPLGERVLIEPSTGEERTKGGIYIPDSAKETKKEGTVIEVGTTKQGTPLPLSKGDKVLYGGYSNEEFQIENETYLIVEAKDILAKLGGQ